MVAVGTRDVVVGVDGSAGAAPALRWATAEAARRGGRLRVVGAYRAPWPPAHPPAGVGRKTWALMRTEETVSGMVDDARAAAPGLVVIGLSVHGAPVPVLMAAAADGALTVVGHRGHEGFAGLRLGSTGLQLATHAGGPVVVVRGTPDAAAPVLLGADGSTGAEPAIGSAFQAAAERGCGVVAVRVYQIPAPKWDDRVDPLDYNLERLQEVEHLELRRAIAPWRDKYPEVPVEMSVRLGEPADLLTAMSAAASLVVVGTRGHGGFTGMLLGSVGQKLLHHAHCPVMIAR